MADSINICVRGSYVQRAGGCKKEGKGVYFWHVAFHDRLSPLPSNALYSVSRWPVLKEVSLGFVNER